MTFSLPTELEAVRDAARKALGRLRPADNATAAPGNFLFSAQRSDAGRLLPAYYLVYFLLVDLLGFKNLGRFEKIDWSLPVDLDGRAFLIEHRKFGVGIFVEKLPEDEAPAAEIVHLISKAITIAEPYFQWLADKAATTSNINVNNRSRELYDQYRYFADDAQKKITAAKLNEKERIVTLLPNGGETWQFPSLALKREAKWLRLAAVEQFFSWTEHIFIHFTILSGKIATGDKVAELASQQWADKYKAAIGLDDPVSKLFYDQLIILRRQVRNFVAHGSFGKDGEALHFHSSAGAVPMLLTDRGSKSQLSFGTGLDFDDEAAIALVEQFIGHLWAGPREPAKIYIQESSLPLILTYAQDGSYQKAMCSVENMIQFADHLGDLFDRHANMDF